MHSKKFEGNFKLTLLQSVSSKVEDTPKVKLEHFMFLSVFQGSTSILGIKIQKVDICLYKTDIGD